MVVYWDLLSVVLMVGHGMWLTFSRSRLSTRGFKASVIEVVVLGFTSNMRLMSAVPTVYVLDLIEFPLFVY